MERHAEKYMTVVVKRKLNANNKDNVKYEITIEATFVCLQKLLQNGMEEANASGELSGY
jgi:hypothetical protein